MKLALNVIGATRGTEEQAFWDDEATRCGVPRKSNIARGQGGNTIGYLLFHPMRVFSTLLNLEGALLNMDAR
jgi:hypothetical protein